MLSLTYLVLICLTYSSWISLFHCLAEADADEPVCTSRYDFESKLLKNMVKLDFEFSILNDKYLKDIQTISTSTKVALNKIEELSNQLTKNQDLLNQTVSDQIVSIENSRKHLEGDFADLYKNLETKNDAKLTEIQGKALKAPIVFNFNTLTKTNPANNEVLIFSDEITNVGNAYDSNTGYFTSTVEGTYVFAVQVCVYNKKSVYIELLVDGNAVAKGRYYEQYAYICSTLNAFVYLNEGSLVCVRNGPSTYGNIIYQDSNHWNMFMGALVHKHIT